MDTTTTPATIVRAKGEGESRWFYGGGIHTWKARPHETNGAFHFVEFTSPAGKVTPLHTHPDSDESFYVLEGEIVVHVDGVDHRVSQGGFAMAPRGVPHAFMTTSEVRLLCWHTPGVHDGFYLDASRPLEELTEDERVVDFDIVRAAAAKNADIELIGPPPFSSPASA